MQQQFVLDLKEVQGEQQAKTAAEILLSSIVEDNVLKKQIGKDFLNKCLRNLQSQQFSSEIKFYTLSIFKYFNSKEKNVLKIFSLLSGHPLFNYFTETAKKVDPRKSISQKGKSLFANNKELGNKFMRLLLESIKIWSERFPQNSNQQPTKYKRAYTKLLQQKVIFPDSYIFYGGNEEQKQQKKTPGQPSKTKKTQSKQPKVQASQEKKQTKTQKPSSSSQQQKQIQGQIRFLYNKIQLFMGILQDQSNENPDQILRQITKHHLQFQKQQKKLETMDPSNIQDETSMSLLFKISQFFAAEKKVYEDEISGNDDLKMYIDTILLSFDSIFGQQQAAGRKSQKPKQKISQPKAAMQASKKVLKQKTSPQNENNNTSSISNKQQKRKYQSTNSEKQKQKPKKQNRQPEQQNQNQSPQLDNKNNKKQKQGNAEIKDKALRSFFDSHMDRPANKSVSGFKAIKESLEKEKKQLKANALRGRSPHNANSLSRSKFNASTVSKKRTNTIFDKPPNAAVKLKKYDGTVVSTSYQLQNILFSLNKQQGNRRFKISNLKNRSLLFQSQHMQIGYKSQPLYDQIQGQQDLDQIIQFQLFIGNKTSKQITNLNIIFQGDQKSLVYSSPQKVQQTIKAGQQSKMDVVVIPKHRIYSLINMKLTYQFQGKNIQTGCILPSSVLKFATYQKADTRMLRQYENTAFVAYQTEKFMLSHYFPPRKIAHYIEELTQLTNYADFAQNGSETDFVLAAFVVIKDKFSGLLKINIRPDLSVVIQLKSNEQKQEAQRQFTLVLQTLELVLKETR